MSQSQFSLVRRQTWLAQRSASQGAGITLVSGCGVYTASFECAQRCAQILGDRDLEETADGIYESVPVYHIPLENVFSACHKLARKYSIALVDLTIGKHGTLFVLIWRIDSMVVRPGTPSRNIEDY